MELEGTGNKGKKRGNEYGVDVRDEVAAACVGVKVGLDKTGKAGRRVDRSGAGRVGVALWLM